MHICGLGVAVGCKSGHKKRVMFNVRFDGF